MRGKDQSRNPAAHLSGITPAYAGKSSGWRWVITISQDHPRLCGEKGNKFLFEKFAQGSPPPMRGKESDGGQQKTIGRITPAYAGKSDKATERNPFREDHPRLCGEKLPSVCTGGKCGGSPPPMRGKVQFFEKQQDRVGITPAYAGKSQIRPLWRTR